MKRFSVALLLIGAAAFLWAVIALFQIRFARGDIYPAYSTLRTDPLGAKAFFESLSRLDQFEVTRNEKPLDQFSAANTTLFCLGATGLSASEKEIENLEQFVNRGGRLVITFYPQSTDSFLVERPKPTPSPKPSPSASPEEAPPLVKFLSTLEVAKRWEFKTHTDKKLFKNPAQAVEPTTVDQKISWHSALQFKDSASVWKIVYASGEFPVVIERAMGEGSIVLASDSYFASNEALRRERHAAFLSWLVGKNRRVMFDETHLGINESPGISTLMRRYHLGGLLAGLIVLAVLAIWKNSARLLPATEDQTQTDEVIAGKDSFAGFVNLLRRNVTPPELLPLCLEQWTKFMPQQAAKSKTKIDRAREILERSARNPVVAYQEIARTLHETKWKPHKVNSPKH